MVWEWDFAFRVSIFLLHCNIFAFSFTSSVFSNALTPWEKNLLSNYSFYPFWNGLFSPAGSPDGEDCLTMRISFSPLKLQCRVCSTSQVCGILQSLLINTQAELKVRLNVYATYQVEVFFSMILVIVCVLLNLCGTQIFIRCPVSFDLISHFFWIL